MWDIKLKSNNREINRKGCRMEEKEKKGNKKRNKLHCKEYKYFWILSGIVISLITSALFVVSYGLFRNKAEGYMENPLETEQNITMVYKNNHVLYRDLYNMVNKTDLDYLSLYYPPVYKTENAVTDTSNNRSDSADIAFGYDDERWFEEAEAAEETGDYELYYSMQKIDRQLEDYFNNLENRFSALNNAYDYMIRDLNTGNIITNTAEKEELPAADYYFYLSFIYDDYGNVTIGDTVIGENHDTIRKTATEISRNGNSSHYIFGNEYYNLLNTYYNEQGPVNCIISYGVTHNTWNQLQNGNSFLYSDYSPWNNLYYGFINAGGLAYYILLLAIVMIIAYIWSTLSVTSPWKHQIAFKLPLEALVFTVFMLCGLGESYIVMAVNVITGRTQNSIISFFGGNNGIDMNGLSLFLSYIINILLLMLAFFCVWYLGICLRGIREYGFWDYIKKRSIIYRFFPFIKKQIIKVYKEYTHFDVTKNANKKIIKLILINAVILFIISSLWFGGAAITVVYSIILYLILKKYVSDLQKKYSILLSATNEIAEGNLNVMITENLGVFEPFKPQIIRIQQGFRNAVEEEVKSQRMKTELITNVSHDLKTPLTAIITYISLLKDETITKEQRIDYLNTLEKKSLRLKVLIEDLFEVSKATSKNIQLNIMDVDIMNLIKQVELELADKLQAAGLDIRMNLSDARIMLKLDSQKTYRIYENLFGNIVKYALPGTRVYVNGFRIDDTVVITLKNITAEEIEVSTDELMDRFVRGDTARNTEGSGLGLSIVKSFVELQNGTFTIEIDGDLFKASTIWKIPTQ